MPECTFADRLGSSLRLRFYRRLFSYAVAWRQWASGPPSKLGLWLLPERQILRSWQQQGPFREPHPHLPQKDGYRLEARDKKYQWRFRSLPYQYRATHRRLL